MFWKSDVNNLHQIDIWVAVKFRFVLTSLTVLPRKACHACAVVSIQFREIHTGGAVQTLVARTGINVYPNKVQ